MLSILFWAISMIKVKKSVIETIGNWKHLSLSMKVIFMRGKRNRALRLLKTILNFIHGFADMKLNIVIRVWIIIVNI